MVGRELISLTILSGNWIEQLFFAKMRDEASGWEDQISSPGGRLPDSYWKTISPLIGKAKDFLENGETLAPVAFCRIVFVGLRHPCSVEIVFD